MQTVKTGVVVALLLAVCYGAFVALNAPDPELPPELEQWATESDMDSLVNVEVGVPSSPTVATGVGTTDLGTLPNLDLPTIDVGVSTGNVNQPPTGSLTSAQNATPVGPSIALPQANSTAAPQGTDVAGNSTGLIVDMDSLAVPEEPISNNAQTATEFPSIPLLTEKANTPASPASQSFVSNSSPPLLNPGANSGGLNEPSLANPSATQGSDSSGQSLAAFSIAREEAIREAEAGRLREALEQLSRYYNEPELTSAEKKDLREILDALSREVIFSQRHLVVSAYTVAAGESVASVAEKFFITPELLTNINQLGNSQALVPGQKLKVVQGPFRAEVSLVAGEITMFAGNLYACRFPFSAGTDPAPQAGSFEVIDKRRDRSYYGAGNKFISAESPQNPYGKHWIDLGRNFSIHGSPEMESTDLASAGCISLSPIDAADVYIMLTKGSRVEIR